MNKYTKQITAIAISSLFAPWAHAQVSVHPDGTSSDPSVASGTGPLLVDGDTQVTGTLTVQPENVTSSTKTDTSAGAGVDPSLGTVNATTTTVVTKLGETDIEETSTTGGGAVIENNGDATFSATTGSVSEANISRFTSVDVFNAGQPNAGTPDPTSQIYFAADANGNPISPTFTSETDLDNWIAATPLTDPAYSGLVTTNPTASSGGDVSIGGNLEVGAVTDVEAALSSNTAGVSTNTAGISTNVSNIATNSTGISTNVSNIATNSTGISTNVTNIATNSTNIDTEVATRSDLIRRESDGFIHIGNNSMIYDDVSSTTSDRLTSSKSQLIIGGNATTDVLVDANLDVAGNANFQQNVNVVGDVFINGNPGVQSQLNDLDNRVDENARGIAMVAALQHTTVLPGMTNALDVSAAHFEGETGMSINYARRINENVQINFGAASTTDFEESVIKAGVGYQW